VVTGQAGPGIIMADLMRAEGVEVPPLSQLTRQRIADLLPPLTFTANPVDTGRPGETFGDVLRAVASDPAIAAIVVYQVVEPALDLARVLTDVASEISKPVVLASGGPAAELEPLFRTLEGEGIACYPAPERAARAVLALVEDARVRPAVELAPRNGQSPSHLEKAPKNWRDALDVAASLAAHARREGRKTLYEDEAKQLLTVLGFVAPQGSRLNSKDGAVNMAQWLGYPVVAKLLAPDLGHKSEAGAVKLDLRDGLALRRALAELEKVAERLGATPAYLIERYLPGQIELIIGARHDPSFGPTVLAGAGGTLAELLEDVSPRLAPIDEDEAERMLDDLKAAPLLRGYRSAASFDHRHVVARLLAALSYLIGASPDIDQVDVNPLILRPDGVFAADALVVLS
jgi:acetyltransferase